MLTRKLLIATCLIIVGCAVFLTTPVLPETLEPIDFILLPLAGGSVVTAAGMLLGLFAKLQTSSPVSVVLGWFSESWTKNLSLGALLTFYIAFIRPILLKYIPLIVIIEWIFIVLVMLIFYVEVKSVTLDFRGETKFSQWQKHVPNIKEEVHSDFNYISYIQDLFVNSGKKELMLVYYALQLREQGESERDILRKIQKLLEYQDNKIPFFAFPWTKKKIQKMNRDAKEELLKKLVDEITERKE